jgi:ribosomal protein S18 acetylase RimI-like enzyme
MLIEELDAAGATAAIPALGAILRECVEAGASVSFLQPFPQAEAERFFVGCAAAVAAGTRRLLVARDAAGLLGTVQVDLATPPNQRHRAEVMKLLVRPAARRRGAARALMLRAEAVVRAAGRSLITLDTAEGSAAEPLYRGLGFTAAGVIPGYALSADRAALEATVIFWKRLG